MRIEVIPQIELGTVKRIRVGDVLNKIVTDSSQCDKFRFTVAYMRMSGWNRLAGAVDNLLNRGGTVSGAIGVDGVTTIEALQSLAQVSTNSTVFYTTSGYIFHPKLYLMNNESKGVAVIGSANLTRDGLFRNVEMATAVELDFQSSVDQIIFNRYDEFISTLLDTSKPNVQPISDEILRVLAEANLIGNESRTIEPGTQIAKKRTSRHHITELESLFPPLSVPAAPPMDKIKVNPAAGANPPIITPPAISSAVSTFLMQLSSFDSSHRTGVPGTPEILIPHEAVTFFPPLSKSGRKYPDVNFDVVLNTPEGRERHNYRLWYYEQRAVGTKIDEYRLRLDHDTIDFSSLGGGDLIVINKLPEGSDPAYEITILNSTDPTFSGFLSFCTKRVYDKKWGII